MGGGVANGARTYSTNQPTRAVYAEAVSAHAWPRRETAPSVPGATFFPLEMRYAFGERMPISLARVSAPATASTLTYTSPVRSWRRPVVRAAIAATVTGAIPFARTFEDFRSP